MNICSKPCFIFYASLLEDIGVISFFLFLKINNFKRAQILVLSLAINKHLSSLKQECYKKKVVICTKKKIYICKLILLDLKMVFAIKIPNSSIVDLNKVR